MCTLSPYPLLAHLSHVAALVDLRLLLTKAIKLLRNCEHVAAKGLVRDAMSAATPLRLRFTVDGMETLHGQTAVNVTIKWLQFIGGPFSNMLCLLTLSLG